MTLKDKESAIRVFMDAFPNSSYESCKKVVEDLQESIEREADRAITEILSKVVEDKPIIEVGDVVSRSGDAREHEVVAIEGNLIDLRANHIIVTRKEKLSLIRKGPKKHVFEGVTLNRSPKQSSTSKQYTWFYRKGLNHEDSFNVADSNKTYRMTLEEMED